MLSFWLRLRLRSPPLLDGCAKPPSLVEMQRCNLATVATLPFRVASASTPRSVRHAKALIWLGCEQTVGSGTWSGSIEGAPKCTSAPQRFGVRWRQQPCDKAVHTSTAALLPNALESPLLLSGAAHKCCVHSAAAEAGACIPASRPQVEGHACGILQLHIPFWPRRSSFAAL